MEHGVQSLGSGEWLLRLREWTTVVHPDAAGRPPVLPADLSVRQQIEALGATGGLAVELLRGGFRVEARSFVGRVKVGPLTIVVEPKIARAPMIQLLRYAFGLRGVTTFDRLSHGAATLGFEDLIALELAAEVSELMARGLNRCYVARGEDLSIPRGRIDFERLARTERTTATLPCRHHLRLVDTPLNRALVMGLEQARRVSTDGEVRAVIHRVRTAFDGVTEPRLSRSVLNAANRQLDRTTGAYAAALALIDLLLDGAGVVLGDGRAVPLQGFLFDMNRFFQALLGRFLRDYLEGGAVIEERPLRGMLRWDSASNPQRLKDPLPRPDFAVRVAGDRLELLDAKYQDLAHRPPSRGVIYQLAMYALSRDGNARATVLHPGSRTDREQVLLVCTPTRGDGQARVVLRPVDLEYIHGLLSRGARRERVAYAHHVAFG
jgi:5-methylcytosine-specific restriction enzyme subunit McrC